MSKGSKGRNRRWCGTPRGCLTVERAPVDLHESDEAEKAAELAARGSSTRHGTMDDSPG